MRIDRSAELADEAAAQANRRRLALLCLIPSAIVGLVLGVIVAVLGFVVVALVVLVAVTVALAAWIRATAAGRVVSALGARPSLEADRPRLHNLVEGLCATMGLDRPEIWVVDSPLANALVVGRDAHRTTLVVTSGLEERLSLVELEGVLAHELVHVKRDDAAVAAVAVQVASLWGRIAGEAAGDSAVHRWCGAGREFAADQRAAQVVRYPDGIAGALASMAAEESDAPWPPGAGRLARCTRWLWIDPLAGVAPAGDGTGDLDDTRVRAAALTVR